LTGFGKSERGRFGNKGATMHQHAVTAEEFADIHDKMEVFGRVDEGPVLTTIGRHPSLGSCVLLKDFASDLILLSEIPFETGIHGPYDA
jgi:hypothetical protein